MTFRPKLAIDLSTECFKPSPVVKPWLDFRSFVRDYWELLTSYRLLVSEQTRIILLDVAAEIKKKEGKDVDFTIEDLGNPRVTRNKIADRRGGEIEQVLWFLDPKSLLEQLKTEPLKMMSERGQKIRINFGAALWAEQQWKLRTTAIQPQSEINSGESIVMVEENALEILFEFMKGHLNAVRLFPHIMTTDHIKRVMEAMVKTRGTQPSRKTEELRAPEKAPRVSVYKDNPHGELIGIGRQIVQGYYNVSPLRMRPALSSSCHVVAFTDYEDQPGIQMQKFYEMCADPRLKVNLLLNPQTAEDWINQFDAPQHSFSAGAYS
jgi:hypothetical protein